MSKMAKSINAKGLKISGLYFNGENVEVKEVAPLVLDVREARVKIKTRTRNFVNYLKTVFADRYEFFIECRAEGLDVVTVGDKAKFKNIEIHVNYALNQMTLFGERVLKSMAEVEAVLGRVRRATSEVAAFANQKVLKTKKQIEKLMTKKNQMKSRMKDNEQRSRVMVFSF